MFRNTGEFFYREKFKCSEDYDLYLRMLTSGKNLTNLPNILVKYRIREGSFMSTKPNQGFYFQKAKDFYLQREKFRKDNYENLSPPLKEQKQESFDKLNIITKILAQFQDNQMRQTRKNIKKYFKEYGFNKSLGIYYILSFSPYEFTAFLKKIVP